MANPSNTKNPLDYPKYAKGIRPHFPESLGQYVDDELEKLQNATENLAYASAEFSRARVAEESFARETADEAIAGKVTLVEASLEEATASLEEIRVAYATADAALASRTSTLEATVNNAATGVAAAHAKISSEEQARVKGDSANATAITNLSTTVSGHTASISSHASSIDGLKLRYSVTLDSNGHITGFEQNNDGKTGQFIVRADVFKVVSPGQTPRTMFQVDSSGVHYTGKASVTGLTSGTLNADMNMGSGRIIWDNGTFMKVAGVGFGSANQFIEWFGPKMAISQCSEANAVTYLKTNGDAYFGGSLSAGVYKNAAQTSSASTTAYVEMDPFLSRGRPRRVTLSYSFANRGQRSGNGSVSGSFAVGTVTLYRSTDDGGTWTQISSMNITSENFSMVHRGGILSGTGSFTATASEPARFDMTASQSMTITDSHTTTGNVCYRAVLSGRTQYTVSGSAPFPDTTTQGISIVSVEE